MTKPFPFLAMTALVLTVGCSTTKQISVQDETVKQRNKVTVEQSFQQWQEGTGSPFELLSDEMQWTISGFNRYAGTYTLESFQAERVEPFNQRTKEPLKPTQWEVLEDDDVVIIQFDAETTLINGQQYRNSYAWFFTFEGSEVTKVRAFLDMSAFEEVLELDIE